MNGNLFYSFLLIISCESFKKREYECLSLHHHNTLNIKIFLNDRGDTFY